MKSSEVSFAELRALLLDLGFQETVEKTRLVFEHPVGGTLLFRRYKGTDRISLGDMLVVRGQLEDNGVIEAGALARQAHVHRQQHRRADAHRRPVHRCDHGLQAREDAQRHAATAVAHRLAAPVNAPRLFSTSVLRTIFASSIVERLRPG